VDERDAVLTRCNRQEARTAQFRELHRQRSDAARRAEGEDALTAPDAQGVVDALQRGQPVVGSAPVTVTPSPCGTAATWCAATAKYSA
jgi:hypothetical protein